MKLYYSRRRSNFLGVCGSMMYCIVQKGFSEQRTIFTITFSRGFPLLIFTASARVRPFIFWLRPRVCNFVEALKAREKKVSAFRKNLWENSQINRPMCTRAQRSTEEASKRQRRYNWWTALVYNWSTFNPDSVSSSQISRLWRIIRKLDIYLNLSVPCIHTCGRQQYPN